MDEINKKKIWSLIQIQGDKLKDILPPHPSHPFGRNSYAHICSLIKDKFKCSYKDIENSRIEELKKFIENIK